MQHRRYSVLLASWATITIASSAAAGIPECRNVRLEDVAAGGCELRASAECDASCSRFGVYKKACATRLHTVCREDCTLAPEAACTDECTETCKSECDRGVSITCIHNCFGECVGACDAQCSDAADPDQCRATCEATCDGECDVKCRPVIDVSCYDHCIECCGGSCTARANLDCQTTCQEEEFESCEHELEVECSGSCDVDAALFCNGEYVLAGADLDDCVQALVAKGTLEVEVGTEVSLDSLGAPNASAGCMSTAGKASIWSSVGSLLFALACAGRRIRGRR